MIRRALSVLLLSSSLVSATALQPEFGLRVLEINGPKTVEAGGTASFDLRIKNTGRITWDPDAGFALGAHWRDHGGKILKWDGPRTALPRPVLPGQTLDMSATCEAPGEPGEAHLEWDIVQEGRSWASQKMVQPPTLTAIRIVSGPGFSLEHTDRIGWALAGTSCRINLEILNTGGLAWEPANALAIAAHWEQPSTGRTRWEGIRSPITTRVEPGHGLDLEAQVEMPKESGTWLMRWDMVSENRYWFSEKMKHEIPPMVVVVLPTSAEAWPAMAFGLALLLFGVGFRRKWWPGSWLAERLDLVWLIGTVLLVEVRVLPETEPWWFSLCLLITLGALLEFVHLRFRPFASWLIGSLLIVLLLIDRIYLRFFGDLPSIGATALLGQSDEISASIHSLLNSADFTFAFSIPLGLLVLLLIFRSPDHPRGRLLRASMMSLPALLMLIMLAHQPSVTQVFRRAQVAENTGVLAAHLLDFSSWVHREVLQPRVSERKLNSICRFFRETAPTRAGRPPFFGAGKGMNLVLIQVESLQEFMVDLDIGDEPVMPTLRRWADEGILFTEATDQTGQGRSSDAELLSQISLLPLPDGAASFACAGNHFVSLAGEAAKRGYTTISAVPFDASFWNRRQTHRDYGYRNSLFAGDFKPGRIIGWGLNDRDFLSQMADRLKGLQQPFLAWMITLSLHHPFEGFPDDLQELNVGTWEGSPVGEYIHTMHYLDHALADFEEHMRESGLWTHTIVMLWGDHDAGFRWSPKIAELMGVSPDNLGWYRSQKIPLLVHFPEGRFPSSSISPSIPAGHADIAPTASGLLGIDSSAFPWIGHNLLGDSGDQPIIGEYGCFSDRKHIFLQGEDGKLRSGRCYDRSSLKLLPVGRCRAAFNQARKTEKLSRLILEDDLQQKIGDQLSR